MSLKGYTFNQKKFAHDLHMEPTALIIFEFVIAQLQMFIMGFFVIVFIHMLGVAMMPPKYVIKGLESVYFYREHMSMVIPSSIIVYSLYFIFVFKVGFEFFGTAKRYSSINRSLVGALKMIALVGFVTLGAKALKNK